MGHTTEVMTGAVVNGTVVSGAVVTGAVVTGAVVTGAVVTGAVVTGAVVTGAVVTTVVEPEVTATVVEVLVVIVPNDSVVTVTEADFVLSKSNDCLSPDPYSQPDPKYSSRTISSSVSAAPTVIVSSRQSDK